MAEATKEMACGVGRTEDDGLLRECWYLEKDPGK